MSGGMVHSTMFIACSRREPGTGSGARFMPPSLRSSARHRIRVSLARALVFQPTGHPRGIDERGVSAWAVVAIQVVLPPPFTSWRSPAALGTVLWRSSPVAAQGVGRAVLLSGVVPAAPRHTDRLV